MTISIPACASSGLIASFLNESLPSETRLTTRYAPRQLYGVFPGEAEAIDDIRKTLAATDESRPPHLRYQTELFRAAKLEAAGRGYKVLALGEEEFVFCPTPGACEVYHGMSDMITDTMEEAQAWIGEAEAMGVQAHWRIFRR